MKRVKITVLRREFYPELADEYLSEGRGVGPCPILNAGDVFFYDGGAEMPQGFCPWAWIDIYRGVSSLCAGATNTPWNKRDGESVWCCTDGIRPVVFRLEAAEPLEEAE